MRAMEQGHARGELDRERSRLESIRDGFLADGLTIESEEEALGDMPVSSQHQADVGTETFERERDISIYEQVAAELADVERALKRLDEGSYGNCEACGRPIEAARLEALPAARFCLADQSMAEHEAHLG
ncbi:MAG: TraR/DksA C4-type zinc finger protein [Acidimicrobiales bacterium]